MGIETVYLFLWVSMDNKFSESNQVKVVSSFNELISMRFQGENNAVCWFRDLKGDFSEIVSKLQAKDDITDISIQDLLILPLSEEGVIARDIIINDLNLLQDLGALPVLNLIKSYARDEELGFISTDVYSYHVDRSAEDTDTFLCTYHGKASDIIANHQAEKKVLIPEIRQKLEALYDGPDEGFESFLSEYFFDLHYQPKPGATSINLDTGHLWKLAVDHPVQSALPCIHRAPLENQGEYRLLLIC